MNGPALDHIYGKPCSCYACVCADRARLQTDIEGVRAINRLQAEALAEERDMNRQLTAALAAARSAEGEQNVR
jgi:hypothetical protein